MYSWTKISYPSTADVYLHYESLWLFNSKIGSLFQWKKRENRFSLARYFAARAPFSLVYTDR